VDGGVFAANPVVAAVAEALKRRDEQPADLGPRDLLVVSLGTGQYEVGTGQRRVARWGRVGWMWPRRGEPPLISTFLDGQSDAAHHWADVLLNHEPGHAVVAPAEMGRGPRYFRFQVPLPGARPLDDASLDSLKQLDEAASRLISERDAELSELARRLASGPRLGPDLA